VGTPDVALFDTVIPAAMASFEAALEPYLHEETNYNWVGLATPRDLTRLWSGETTARLDGVRKKYDPEGIFAGAHASA
jgi:hypothetical protein